MRYVSILIFTITCSITNAQLNRRNTQKSVAYQGNYQRLALGNHAFHSAEIRDGKLYVWGYNLYGQLGLGDTKNKAYPVQMKSDSNWVSIGLGFYHSAGLKADGTLWAWGQNTYGQVGDGTKTQRNIPMQIGTDNNWVALSVGDSYNLALKSDGTIWGWGLNFDGQLGDGTNTIRTSPVMIGTDNSWAKVIAGAWHSFGIKADGSIWGWGQNSDGQLGDRTSTNRNVPTKIGTDTKWTHISLGSFHTLGLKSDGTLWAWGYNGDGEFGDSSTISKNRPIPIGEDNKWISIAAGDAFSMGLKADGTLWAWGWNRYGQLGVGDTIDRLKPTKVGYDSNWVGVSPGSAHAKGLKADGTVWAWGSNGFYQLADSLKTRRISPNQITAKLDQWVSISDGKYHTLGLKSTGTILAWGYNAYGELGNGTNSDYINPIEIGTDNDWISIAAGNYHSLGLKADGTAWAWGNNSNGELGDGSNTNRNMPLQIGSQNQWVSIAAGSNHSLLLKANGTLWASGKNDKGQLGDGTNTDRNKPVKISTDSNWVSISAGEEFSIGLQSNGTLWAWGNNSYGQLGIGTKTNQAKPKQITGGKWISINAGSSHTLGLKSDGTLWAWGLGGNGQLGNGTAKDTSSPIQIGTDKTWINLAAGDKHSLALKADGTLSAWGMNTKGQLGNGKSTDIYSPTQMGNTNWVSIEGGHEMSIGIKPNRKQYCATGANSYGQLGDNSTTDKNSFVCNTNNTCAPKAPTNTTPKANLSICSGTNTKLKANGSGKLSWYTKATGGVYLAKDSVYLTNKLTQTTTFYVQDSTCEPSATRTAIVVKVKSPLKVMGNYKDTTMCYGAILNLWAKGQGGDSTAYNFSWYMDTKLLKVNDSLSIKTSDLFSKNGETKVLNLFLKDNCTIPYDSIKRTITVWPNPKPDLNYGLACSKVNTEFKYTGSKPIDSYYWDFNGEETSTLENPNILFSTSGTKKVKLSVSSKGCTDTLSKNVEVNPKPVADFKTRDACQKDSVSFSNQSQNANTYQWKFGDGNFSSKQFPKHMYDTAGITKSYNVTLIASESNGCLDSITKSVSVNELPRSTFVWSITGGKINLIAMQEGNSYYRWLFDNKDSISGKTNPSHSFTNGMTICLKVVNTANCTTQTCTQIEMGGLSKMKTTNIAIYPNPNNGSFTVSMAEPKSQTTIEIINPVGQLIYKGQITQTETFNLNLVNGVYVIRLKNGEVNLIERMLVSK